MDATETHQEPYSSARDLPSFREMEQNIEGMKQLLTLAPAAEHDQLKRNLRRLRTDIEHLAHLVDAFYDKLGSRNWIFTSDLNLETVESIVAINDPTEAEEALVSYYQSDNNVKFGMKRLQRFEAMKPRMPLLQAALADYKHARNYSVVLVLIAVMDGFVNDFEKQTRKGWHARDEEEMFAWDNIVGHHMGLTNAHKTFTKSCRKTVTEEVHDLHRHGIVHGMITNFDNSVISTKAWNHLFAIGDWAEAKLRKDEMEDAPPDPSLEELAKQYRQLKDDETSRSRFRPYVCAPSIADCSALRAAEDYFNRWEKRQWAPLGAHFMQVTGNRLSTGQLALEAKDLYEEYLLEEYSILKIEHFGSMGAHVHASLIINGQTHMIKQRWLHVDDSFSMVDEWKIGHWALSLYGPLTFIKNDT